MMAANKLSDAFHGQLSAERHLVLHFQSLNDELCAERGVLLFLFTMGKVKREKKMCFFFLN